MLENEQWYRAASTIPTRELTRPESTNIENRERTRRGLISLTPGIDEASIREYWERASRPIEPSFGVDWEASINRSTQQNLDLPAMGSNPTGRREVLSETGRAGRNTPFVPPQGPRIDLDINVNAPRGTRVGASDAEGVLNEPTVKIDNPARSADEMDE
jgi:hypothetical protein